MHRGPQIPEYPDVSDRELQAVVERDKRVISMQVTLSLDCEQPLQRICMIDAKLRAVYQVLDSNPKVPTWLGKEASSEVYRTSWLIATDTEPEYIKRWVELMLDVNQVEIAEYPYR
ncbi:hypothetical protein [Paenibacillus aceti]|uniref:Uncharacterized protein n=1 Tax=Paenibacillus aceti TaxID=1820010 RepID=A0ABQ1W659_9BACL|nr:hypothetical protein [Paenibacillus aceti]GGG15528.1 hypothetical protein GCM10010913_41820 [Paenibacillus aceti]